MSKKNLLSANIMNNVDALFVDGIVAHYALWYATNVQTPEWEFLSKIGDLYAFINFVTNSINKGLYQRFGDKFKEELRKMPMEEAFEVCTQLVDQSLLKLSNVSAIGEFLSKLTGGGPVFVAPGLLD